MISRYDFSLKFNSGAVVKEIPFSTAKVPYFAVKKAEEIQFSLQMSNNCKIYGLGENVRGINKRGHLYISNNTDDPTITEDRVSLYASHNFLIINNVKEMFGLFFDTPNKVKYDLGYSDIDEINISSPLGFELYVIEGKSELDIIKQFRELIGKSYLPPYYSFGVGQSRWGYSCKDDILRIINDYEKLDMPLDLIYMDIDCLDNFKDFTLNETFGNPKQFVDEVKSHNIYLVPIVDAALKVDDSYPVYTEGKKLGHYAFGKDGNPYVVGVWPGDSVLPDFFNEEASKWFASKYQFYLDIGITSFWNDMNEPVLFYTKDRVQSMLNLAADSRGKNLPLTEYHKVLNGFAGLQNNEDDYNYFFHHFNGEVVSHKYLHNYYSYYMVKETSNYLKENSGDEGFLLFSRSSCIGSHRYSGIWTGDNASWWEHLLLNFKMMPSLNMCGYLYSGADLGGFGKNSTEDLVLRWLAFGLFSPLLRNHSSCGTKLQEFCYLKRKDVFRNLLKIRYALMPYIYHSFVSARENNSLLFTPLNFVYKNDENVNEIEDELLFGDSLILAPIFQQNTNKRYVYLPENCMQITMKSDTDISCSKVEKGHHIINVNLDEVTFFLLEGHSIPLTKNAKNINDVKSKEINFINNEDKSLFKEIFVPKGKSFELKKVELK